MLLVTGPVTRNMAVPLRMTHDATPDPKLVVAVGDCARTCGVFAGSYAVAGPVDSIIPVDAYIDGCPPEPTQILQGILAAIGGLDQNRSATQVTFTNTLRGDGDRVRARRRSGDPVAARCRGAPALAPVRSRRVRRRARARRQCAGGRCDVDRALGYAAPAAGGVSLRLDSLGAFFLVIVGFTGVPASLCGLGYLRDIDGRMRSRTIHAVFNVFLASMCIVPCADNAATFLFSWEVMALSSYLLVVSDPDQPDASSAGLWYAAMTHAGFLALLAAFVILGQGGSWEFVSLRNAGAALTPAARATVFLLIAAAFGSKAGLVPLHVWLPRAHPAAPSHVSALMSAAMVNLGVYGTVRVVFDLLPPGPPWWEVCSSVPVSSRR